MPMNSQTDGVKKIRPHYYLITSIIIWLLLNIPLDFFYKEDVWNGSTVADQSGFGPSMLSLIGIMCVMFGIMLFINRDYLGRKSILQKMRIEGVAGTMIMTGLTIILAVILYSMVIIC